MKREADLRRRLHSLSLLGEAVGAMKSLSAHHFREARRAVEPARVYREGVERMLDWCGVATTPGTGGAGLLVIGGELGLCGAYNARVADVAMERRVALGDGPTVCVGRRAATLLQRRELTLQATYSGPTSVRGITAVLLRLAEHVLVTYVQQQLASFDIVSNRFAGVGVTAPTSVRLLPFEPKARSDARAVRYVEPNALASAVTREFLYIMLHDLLLDALASEHGARLLATEGAQAWLDTGTERLRRRLAAVRREASTQEMLEIAGGARALARNP
jgi:F-type H+-transporting ATPase subunit gamma